jgi:hypothetical protein
MEFIMYALIDDDTGRRLGEFREVRGFFAGNPEEQSLLSAVGVRERTRLDFSAIGADYVHSLREGLPGSKNPANLYVQVLAADGEPIGEYYVAAAAAVLREDARSRMIDIDISGLMDRVPHRDAEKIWQRWAVAPPDRKGLWAELPLGGRLAWLEVAGLCRQFGGSRESGPEGVAEFFMDGENIHDIASFFCAIGEAMNGPGGYYGRNLPALADCFAGGCGPRAPYALYWSHFDVARGSLSEEVKLQGKRTTQLDLITDVFNEAGVELRI